jgi:hypothetical protein
MRALALQPRYGVLARRLGLVAVVAVGSWVMGAVLSVSVGLFGFWLSRR